jgi:hypothetical protein
MGPFALGTNEEHAAVTYTISRAYEESESEVIAESSLRLTLKIAQLDLYQFYRSGVVRKSHGPP